MSNYNWCHNPDCHTIATVSRIIGSKGNKVLLTVKIKVGRYNWNNDTSANISYYFCNQNCLYQFIHQHIEEIVKIAPRREALETPITDQKKKTHTSETRWGNHSWTTTEIKEVDNNSNP